jgi:hypothetical protein
MRLKIAEDATGTGRPVGQVGVTVAFLIGDGQAVIGPLDEDPTVRADDVEHGVERRWNRRRQHPTRL